MLQSHGLHVLEFPYVPSRDISAEGCYLNYLETDTHIFLPIFGKPKDREVELAAQQLFRKEIVPVNICKIAREGGALNCISREHGMDALPYCK